MASSLSLSPDSSRPCLFLLLLRVLALLLGTILDDFVDRESSDCSDTSLTSSSSSSLWERRLSRASPSPPVKSHFSLTIIVETPLRIKMIWRENFYVTCRNVVRFLFEHAVLVNFADGVWNLHVECFSWFLVCQWLAQLCQIMSNVSKHQMSGERRITIATVLVEIECDYYLCQSMALKCKVKMKLFAKPRGISLPNYIPQPQGTVNSKA